VPTRFRRPAVGSRPGRQYRTGAFGCGIIERRRGDLLATDPPPNGHAVSRRFSPMHTPDGGL